MIFFIYCRFRSDSGTAFDDQSSSLIKLNNSTVLYLREVNKFLALVCILREYSFSRQGVIDFNFLCFREAIHQVFTVKKSANTSIFDEEDDDEDDDDDDDDNDDDPTEQDDDDFVDPKSRIYMRSRYESDEDLNHVNNQHFVRSPAVQNH